MPERISQLSSEEKQQIDIRMKLNSLINSTEMLSGGFSKHPSAEPVLEYGEEALRPLLGYLEECREADTDELNPWVAFDVIREIVAIEELPLIPEEALGKVESIIQIYCDWGTEKGYLLEDSSTDL